MSLIFFLNCENNCMFCGGICRQEDTRWHWTVNLPPKPGHLQEEEISAGLLREYNTMAFTPWWIFPGLWGGNGQDKGLQWHVLPVGQPFTRESRATEAAELKLMFLVGPLQLNYSKSTSVFTTNHPEPQNFAYSREMSSYEALRGPRSCYLLTASHVGSVKSQQKGSKGKKAGKGVAGVC